MALKEAELFAVDDAPHPVPASSALGSFAICIFSDSLNSLLREPRKGAEPQPLTKKAGVNMTTIRHDAPGAIFGSVRVYPRRLRSAMALADTTTLDR